MNISDDNRQSPGLIIRLAERATPVRRLTPPLWRWLIWLSLAFTFLAFVVLVEGPRPNLALYWADRRFRLEFFACALTGISASYVLFHQAIPGSPRRLWLLPLPFLALWLGAMGYGCMLDWRRIGAAALDPGISMPCAQAISGQGLVLSLALVAMLRRAAPLEPLIFAAMSALAATALAATGLLLYHPLESSLTIMIWHGGAIFAVILLFTLARRWIFPPVASRLAPLKTPA